MEHREDDVPEEHQAAAEEVRAHLVCLRGGAPFLSPNDALLLLEWLDAGVSVPAILRALERAAQARIKNRSRLPLTLGSARRHLDKPTSGALAPASSGHPLAPTAQVLTESPSPRDHAAARALLALDPTNPEHLVRGALAIVRDLLDATWLELPAAEREALLAQGRARYASVFPEDERGLDAACEAWARDRLRKARPHLSAATIWELVQP